MASAGGAEPAEDAWLSSAVLRQVPQDDGYYFMKDR